MTNDRKSMPRHLADHLAAGGHSPGVFCIRPYTAPADLVAELAMFASAGDPTHYVDVVTFIPL